MKVCKNCGIEKDATFFFNRRAQCKDCVSKKAKEYYEKNKDVLLEQKKKYHEVNKTIILEKKKLYHKANKELLAQKNKKYIQDNKEKITIRKKKHYEENRVIILEKKKIYTKENKKKISEKNKKYFKLNRAKVNYYQNNKRKNDPYYKFKHNVGCLIRDSFKRRKHLKNQKTVDILGCSLEDFKIYIRSKFKKGMTLDNYGEWHLDHIIPLATAINEEEIIKLNHYTNFQPLWAKENLSKSAKIIEQQLILI
jgi:hypothetical protein